MYLTPIPSVKKGIEQAAIGGQLYDLPKAFMDRLMHDASVAYQNQGFNPTRQDVISTYFRPAAQGMYTAYAGLGEYLDQMKKKYSGSGYANPYQTQATSYRSQYNQQKKLPNIQKVSMGGQVTSSTPRVNEQQLINSQSLANRYEKKQRADLMRDLEKFKTIGQQTVVSNMPVKIIKPTY